MATGPIVVGIDLGGTNMQIGTVDGSNTILGRTKLKTRAEKGGDAVVQRMIEGVEEACDKGGVRLRDLAGVGIGAPGAIDLEEGVVLEAPNLRWNNMPLARRLSEGLADVPVLLDNDVNVAVYGENRLGVGGNAPDVMGLWIGTGIGGGLILNGRLYYGGGGTAGEVGQMILFPNAPLGNRTLEQNCSRKHLVERLLRLIHANHASNLIEIAGGDGQDIGASSLAESYNSGDRLTRAVLDEAAQLLGVAIAGCVTLLSLPVVLLGGGLGEAMGQPFAERVAASLKQHVFPASLGKCRVLATRLADDAGLLGAALLAREKFGHRR